ncbi:unnamed protein product [Gongylonema pulchrum]|uniref:I-set domain-containing protein n=1 Tax=Gongylonema pulchrum TaxID=637853 RepID=A0A3P6SPL6_9BILA|nr:unnamed protein product [Gongylonema pulchrum]
MPATDKAKPKKVSDTVYQLEIPDADKDVTGDYKVVVSDDEGQEAQSSCKLTVKVPALEFTKGLEDQTVDAGTAAILSVEVNSPPKEVKW